MLSRFRPACPDPARPGPVRPPRPCRGPGFGHLDGSGLSALFHPVRPRGRSGLRRCGQRHPARTTHRLRPPADHHQHHPPLLQVQAGREGLQRRPVPDTGTGSLHALLHPQLPHPAGRAHCPQGPPRRFRRPRLGAAGAVLAQQRWTIGLAWTALTARPPTGSCSGTRGPPPACSPRPARNSRATCSACSMLDRLDGLIGLPEENLYQAEQLGIRDQLMTLTIDENQQGYDGWLSSVGCSKNEWGRRIIAEIDRILLTERATERYRRLTTAGSTRTTHPRLPPSVPAGVPARRPCRAPPGRGDHSRHRQRTRQGREGAL